MSIDTVIPILTGLSGAHLIAVEHAELVVALYAAVAALDDNGLHHEASAARAVLHEIAMRAVH
jgi:cobalamin biosynthesis protein CbiG